MKPIISALGRGNAESERRDFDRIFVETSDFKAVESMSKSLVLGGRGSGKSAIFRTLADRRTPDFVSHGSMVYTVAVSADRTSWPIFEQAVKESRNDSLLLARQWEMTLLLLCFNALVDNLKDVKRKRLIRDLDSEVEKILERTDLKLRSEGILSDVFDAAATILRRLPFTFKLEAPLVPISLQIKDDEADEPTPREKVRIQGALIDSMYGVLKQLLAVGGRVQVLADQLDDDWSATKQQIESLRALIKAVARMKDVLLAQELEELINFVVFVREDIYEVLKRRGLDDATKYRQDELHLRWGEASLRSIIDRRLNVAGMQGITTFDDLFTNQRLDRQRLPDYFFSRVVPRPRDVIQFLSFALELADRRNDPKINKQDLLDAESSYSSWRKDVLLEETRYGVLSNSEGLISSFESKSRTYTPRELRAHLDEARREHSVDATKPMMTELLVEWGFLGVSDNIRSAQFVWDRPPSQTLRASDGEDDERWVVHPSLWMALDIRDV